MQFLRMTIIGLLISLSSSYVLMSLSIFLRHNKVMTGEELLEQVMIAAILGIIIGVVSLIFEIERLPFTIQLIMHYIAITICVLTAGYFGHWYDISNIFSFMGVFLSEVIIYVLTWYFINVLLKKDIEEINKSIQKRRRSL